MPNYRTLVQTAINHYRNQATRQKAFVVEGWPGGGKTAMRTAICDALGIPPERQIIWRPSLQTPVDLLGMPKVDQPNEHGVELMSWAPPAELYQLDERSCGDEEWFVTVDEVADCPQMMQNALCGYLYDRFISTVNLGPNVLNFATTNDVKHKSGAVRVISKLPNRVAWHELVTTLEDTLLYFKEMGRNPVTIAFLEWRGIGALFDFEPERKRNATPRSWEVVSFIENDSPTMAFEVQGWLPEGIAEEYIAFVRLYEHLPALDQIISDPKTAPISEKIDVLYALTARLMDMVDKPPVEGMSPIMAFEHLFNYVQRMPREYQQLWLHNVRHKVPEIRMHPIYTNWTLANGKLYGTD